MDLRCVIYVVDGRLVARVTCWTILKKLMVRLGLLRFSMQFYVPGVELHQKYYTFYTLSSNLKWRSMLSQSLQIVPECIKHQSIARR
jgi:hypothetical protein